MSLALFLVLFLLFIFSKLGCSSKNLLWTLAFLLHYCVLDTFFDGKLQFVYQRRYYEGLYIIRVQVGISFENIKKKIYIISWCFCFFLIYNFVFHSNLAVADCIHE